MVTQTPALQSEEALQQRLRKQQLVESLEHMSPVYLEGIKRILTVSADTELISSPAYYHAAVHAPSLNAFGSAISIIQDELGHAHIAYRLLRDLGVDTEQLIFEREPAKFKYPYAFDVPLESWVELVVANAFYDRAGFVLLSDVFQSTTFGPWKRALLKVDKEETFHLRHGEQWMRRLNKDAEGHALLQQAVDWMFLLTVEWFGLPDDLKKHTEQLNYGFKGHSNDELRQIWMSTAVPLCNELQLQIPAHYDEEQGKYVLECPFPAYFNAEKKRWEESCSWDDVMKRWKARGPKNEEFVGMIQRGKKEMLRLLEQK
ncbi:ring-1,2-phenylacetyl-CoA epoxidase subunit PaaA [Thermosporothrix hazakensis]|jgi:ring-1,2-phenylacetyl-CoA epoxidase subunit PaaA|uniref:Ring-1,2-phenylacetyl-CoA epoxidase subunit PaaA n=2 Tax=Thermosporothrix TaxID=768650 RepID=A0A326U4L4_THEHA|nr:Phenylacetic acid catabolic protein [Thermosporothrix hazakensis]PZW26677.1 ring-1,2-phenylacetyl-CoA epoxidase subunit PaaA [Thermosporothrix hazakensis]BBH89439.1 phenylacetate-CoA oxygenase subunit PaaA [Thermosporothrix sp. COM3]GCE47622.1 phenylacetate-CoA oxygenase subunit PaaA [Thermosporothrix hazakensis]